MTWGFKGYPEKPKAGDSDHAQDPKTDPDDWRADEPWRRSPQETYSDLRHRWHWSNVMLPHVLAVALGAVPFFAAAFKAPGFQQFHL
jgi:hypothetical protein